MDSELALLRDQLAVATQGLQPDGEAALEALRGSERLGESEAKLNALQVNTNPVFPEP